LIFETPLGKVKTRETATRIRKGHAVLLKDNPNLKPLFDWLKVNNIRKVDDVEDPELAEKLDEIEFQHEVKWEVDRKFWVIHFYNCTPFKGDFSKAILEYMRVFKEAISKPYDKDKAKLLREIKILEMQLAKLKEQLKEG